MPICVTPNRRPAAKRGKVPRRKDHTSSQTLSWEGPASFARPFMRWGRNPNQKERLVGERTSLPWVVDDCKCSLLIRQLESRPAWSAAMRQDFRWFRYADAFWGRKCHLAKLRRSRVVAVSLPRRIDALVRAGQRHRLQGTHRLLAARLAGSQRQKPECCPCQSAPNHHTKPCHHSGKTSGPCRKLLPYIRSGAKICLYKSFELPEETIDSCCRSKNAVFRDS